MAEQTIDIREDKILARSPELLATLLKDHTMSRVKGHDCNIFWATADYASLGVGFQYGDQILPENITGQYGDVVQPRVCKDHDTQTARSRDKAEVFTPSWICNAQNNLIDAAWFGREGVFNTELPDHTWAVNTAAVTFPEGKTWLDYVRDTRLEITCGEAPYLASRYDTVTGEYIPLERRIGIIDRKLRVVSENCRTSGEWLDAAQTAYKSTYAYEWQGDSLLIARETLLYTFMEYYRRQFGRDPLDKSLKTIAYIISWNVWQMDGLRCVIPGTCGQPRVERGLFGDEVIARPCEGCRTGEIHAHNGIQCLIRDWRKSPRNKQVEPFIKSISR